MAYRLKNAEGRYAKLCWPEWTWKDVGSPRSASLFADEAEARRAMTEVVRDCGGEWSVEKMGIEVKHGH